MQRVLLQKIEGQWVTTLPAEVVQALQLQAGQALEIQVEDGRIVIAPVNSSAEDALKLHEELIVQYADAFRRLAQ